MLTVRERQHMLTTMTARAELVENGASNDPAVGLLAVAALRRLVEQLEDLQVESARSRGWSWAEIAALLGVSKQAVHRKHAGRLLRRDDRS